MSKIGRIGIFSGGIECYWKDTGMKKLPSLLEKDIKKLVDWLSKEFEVIYPGMVGNESDAYRISKTLKEENCDIVLMYHATYVDDAMSLALLQNMGDAFPVLLHSQGFKGIPQEIDLMNGGRTWGNNSAVQITGTLKRMKPNFKYGFVFGDLGDPKILQEIKEYVKAVKAVKKLSKSTIAYLPHRSVAVPMYDTFPDDTMMMAQTGIRIIYLYTQNLIDAMKQVGDKEAKKLCKELYDKYEVIEPTAEEVFLAAKQAIALEKVVKDNKVDALAIDMFPELTPRCGMIPCVGMSRLIDQGIVVATEGDLSVSVGGILLQELAGKPVHFWEHLIFDAEKNWVLGGHEGGSAGFSMAKKGFKPKLRNTQYINFGNMPGAPFNGVLPEFITQPGAVTLINLFRGKETYEMRYSTGESVDTSPRPVHFEHTIFKPSIPLKNYYENIVKIGVCHHFGLVHADVSSELKKVAAMLDMKLECLT